MTIYTRRGDDGTTGLRGGERVRKDEPRIELLGTLDEAQALLGVARAELIGHYGETERAVAELIELLERDLWIVMAEVASPVSDGETTGVGPAMVDRLEADIDRFSLRTELSKEFAVPGENRLSAALDVARTVIRRAERIAVSVLEEPSAVLAYLNRLSDLCWMVARSVETEHRTHHREAQQRG